MPNPFFYGGRITDTAQFVGRDAELRRIFAALETTQSGQAQHISIVGPRRMGKSSLLFHVTQIYRQKLSQPEKYRFVYIDLDDSRCHNLPGLLGHILQTLDVTHTSHPTLDQFQDALRKLTEKQAVMPVLCLDEFEHLTQRKDQFPDAVFEAWRSLGNNSLVVFITASAIPLHELIQQGNLTSNFHNIFTLLPLGAFTLTEAQTLLARSDHPLSAADIEALLKLTGCHPAKLQIAARLFYETPSLPAILPEYNRQVESVFGKKPSRWHKLGWLTKIFSAPDLIGQFICDLLKLTPQKSTVRLMGWAFLIVLVVLVFWVDNIGPNLFGKYISNVILYNLTKSLPTPAP